MTPIILSGLPKNQSDPDLRISIGTATPTTQCMRPNTLNINAKNIAVAISCEMAAMMNIRRVETYRWIIQSGISIPNAIRLANPKNIHTRAILSSKNPKKNTTEK